MQRYEDAFDVSIVVGPAGRSAYNALGRGDFDADGLDDLIISHVQYEALYDSDGDPVSWYSMADTSLLYGSEILPYLE